MTEKMVQTGSDTGEASVLRRKMSASGQAGSGPLPRSLLWALRLALARSAAALCDLPLAVTDAQQSICAQADLAGCLSDDCLLILLDGPDGQVGAVSLDSATVTALIQQQTLGQIQDQTETGRRYTNTDAAMIAPLVNRTLDRAIAQSDDTEDQHLLAEFRFGAKATDVRSLILAMSGANYRVIDLTLDIALGRLHGRLCLILPEVPDPKLSAKTTHSDEPDGPTLEDATGVMCADLRAVVCRLTLPLTRMSQLRPGDMLSLPDRNFNHTELTDVDGRQVVRGKLGQASGARAVRLYRRGAATMPKDQAATEFQDHPAPTKPPGAVEDPLAQDPAARVPGGGPGHAPDQQTTDDALENDGSVTGELMELSPHEIAAEITELAGLEPSEVLSDPTKA